MPNPDKLNDWRQLFSDGFLILLTTRASLHDAELRKLISTHDSNVNICMQTKSQPDNYRRQRHRMPDQIAVFR